VALLQVREHRPNVGLKPEGRLCLMDRGTLLGIAGNDHPAVVREPGDRERRRADVELRGLVQHDEVEQRRDGTSRAIEEPVDLVNGSADEREPLASLEARRQLLVLRRPSDDVDRRWNTWRSDS
jgi:hypothetical protein